MKNNKLLIIIGVILLNVLVVFMIGQSLTGKTNKYEAILAEAREYAKQELCSKAISKYQEAIVSKDTLEIRLEMIDVYEKGIEIGEFTDLYTVVNEVTYMIDAFREEPVVYERACELFIKHNKFEDCAKILMQARDLEVTSEKIEEYRKQVRYMYMEYFSMYTEVMPVYDGMYTVKTESGTYTFLNEELSPAINSTFSYASSFSEGYAFVRSTSQQTAEERSVIINKSGERQVYLDEVTSSSGVGKAKDKDGKDIYLLACKVGEKYKYYDINGKEIFGDYLFAGRFRNNVAAVKEAEGKWKLIDGTGNVITETVFEDVVLNEFDECAPKGHIIAKKGGKYSIYDIKGAKVGDFSCDGAKAFVDDYAAFMRDGLWGFVDATGKVIIEPQYEDAKSFSCMMGAVKTGDGWVFINPDNQIVIQQAFEDVSYLSDKGVCFIKKDGFWSYIETFYTGK